MEDLLYKLKPFKQEHILQFWDILNQNERTNLTEQINNLDLEYILKCYEECTAEKIGDAIDKYLEPVPSSVFGSVLNTDASTLLKYEDAGLKEISTNRVACLLLAGGQGTRLGVDYPKGMYSVNLPSNKTLYNLMAERILKLQQIANSKYNTDCIIPWYIMTSEQTSEPTRKYFSSNKYFGLDEKNVIIFEQSTMPCMTFDGKIIMQTTSSIATSPDGNGGLYNALDRHRVLVDMEKRGVVIVHAHGVDNILVKMADPVFIGFCLDKKANCGLKVVPKSDAREAVGVVCKVHGKFHIAEYSEISTELAERRGDDGQLVFNAGSIANHFFTTSFLNDVIKNDNKLKHHVAKKKKVPTATLR